MTKTCYLITGGTGNVGVEVLKHLFLKRDPETDLIRLAHHDPNRQHHKPLTDQAVDWVLLDLEKPETYAGAMNGCDVLFLLRPPHLTDIDGIFRPLLVTAIKYGLRKVIFLSVQGAEKSSFIPHHKIEKLITDLGMDHIFVRPSYFMQNLTTTLREEIRKTGKIEIPSADARFNWIDVADIGRTTATLLLNFDFFKNHSYVLTGPENLSFSEVSQRIKRVLGLDIPHHSPGILSFFIKRARRINPGYALIQTYLHAAPRFQQEPGIHNDILEITGIQPASIDSFLNRNADLFYEMIKK